jgi:Rod binding domain-containing protein
VSTLPPIDSSVLPADVRKGTEAEQSQYKTALAFERELVGQLTQQLADTATSSEGDEGSSGATKTYQQMLPGVLADSVMQAGGLGLARTIAQSMKESGQ